MGAEDPKQRPRMCYVSCRLGSRDVGADPMDTKTMAYQVITGYYVLRTLIETVSTPLFSSFFEYPLLGGTRLLHKRSTPTPQAPRPHIILPMSFFQQAIRRYPDSYTAQILALDAYSSNLRTRLVSTLDAIDALQLSHKQELEDLQRRMHILHTKNRMLKQRVKLAESERDELREGVESLIRKGAILSKTFKNNNILTISNLNIPLPFS